MASDRDQIHGNALEQCEDGASLRIFQCIIVHRVPIRIVLGADVLASDPAFEQLVIRPVLLVAHLLTKLLEMRGNFTDL